MSQSILAYERFREGEYLPYLYAYWINSGTIWVRQREKKSCLPFSKESMRDDSIEQSVTFLPSELKEILKRAEGSFKKRTKIYCETRITPGMFSETAKVTAVAHPDGFIKIYYSRLPDFSKVHSIKLSFGELKIILSKCQKKGREWWGEWGILPAAGAIGENCIEELDVDIDGIEE